MALISLLMNMKTHTIAKKNKNTTMNLFGMVKNDVCLVIIHWAPTMKDETTILAIKVNLG